MSATTTHAAIDALVSLWTATFADTPVEVYDGAIVTDAKQFQALFVGFDPTDDNGKAVDSRQAWAQMGARRKQEDGTITCSIGTWSGDDSTHDRRVQAAEILSRAEAAHREDITLGGVVQYSNFGENVTLYQTLTDTGNEVLVTFTVSFMSRT